MKTGNYKFNHVGVPTDKVQENEMYFEDLMLYATDPSQTEYFIEYLRPAPGCTFFPVLLENPHVSYQVEDMDAALEGENVIVEPFEVAPGLWIAFIDVNGFIFELACNK